MRRFGVLAVVVGGLTVAPVVARAQVTLNAYGDINYEIDRTTNPTTNTNSFSSPRLELFLQAQQGRLAFLAETMFEVGDNNEFGVDMERIEVAYLFSDFFRLRFGRFHTAIGYYNDAYHHGRYFQTTVDRPEIVRFEDEGGLIPAHSVGIHADGRFPLGSFGALRYDADIANGRGAIPAEVTNLADANQPKAYNLRLRIEPAALDGLIVGVNIYLDTIDAIGDAAAPPLPAQRIDEVILGAHAAYLENNVHLIAEYLHVSHKVSATSYSGTTQAGFLEAGYTFGSLTPYARFQRVSFPDALDTFYAQNVLAAQGSLYATVAGVRFSASDFLALKLEGGYIKRDSGTNTTTGAVQCAFAF